jgi:hypothetical protein
MISSDLILKLRGLTPETRQLLLYVSNRTGDKFISIGKLKEDTHYTNEVIEKTLIKLANINIIDKKIEGHDPFDLIDALSTLPTVGISPLEIFLETS